MPTTEVLKQLLDEFTEKEALIKEELNIINEQIEELTKRLNTCRTRLETIGADREKVVGMKERYANGPSNKTADKVSDKVGKAAKKSKEKRLTNNEPQKVEEAEIEAMEISTPMPSVESTPFESNIKPSLNLAEVWQVPEEIPVPPMPFLPPPPPVPPMPFLTNTTPEETTVEENVSPPPLSQENQDVVNAQPNSSREDKSSSPAKKGSSPFESLLDLSSESDKSEGDADTIDKTLSEALKNLWGRDLPPQ